MSGLSACVIARSRPDLNENAAATGADGRVSCQDTIFAHAGGLRESSARVTSAKQLGASRSRSLSTSAR